MFFLQSTIPCFIFQLRDFPTFGTFNPLCTPYFATAAHFNYLLVNMAGENEMTEKTLVG